MPLALAEADEHRARQERLHRLDVSERLALGRFEAATTRVRSSHSSLALRVEAVQNAYS